MARGQFGSIRKLPSGRFQAKHLHPHTPYIANGTRNYITAPTTFRTKAEARLWLSKQESAIAQETWKDEATRAAERADAEAQAKRDALTFAEYAAEWLTRYEGEGYRTHESRLRLHILPTWADVRLIDIRRADVRRWLENSINGHSRREKVRETMYTCLNRAYRDELIERNPIPSKGDIHHREDTALSETPARAKPSLTFPEIEALANAVGDAVANSKHIASADAGRLYALGVRLMGLCGMRLEEMRGASAESLTIDAEGRVWLTIERVVQGRGKNTHKRNRPKNRNSLRTIPLPAHVGRELAALAAGLPKGAPLLADWKQDGEPIRETSIGYWMGKASKDTAKGHTTPHDLRHSFTTEAIYLAPQPAVQAYMGHAAQDMTGYYTRIQREQLADLAEAIERSTFPEAMPSIANLEAKRRKA